MESPASRRGWVVGAERVILTLAHPELPHFKRMEEIIWIYLTFLRCQSVRSYPETMLRIQIHIITIYHFLETTKKAKNGYLCQHGRIYTILTAWPRLMWQPPREVLLQPRRCAVSPKLD